jgi:hypothetical protein
MTDFLHFRGVPILRLQIATLPFWDSLHLHHFRSLAHKSFLLEAMHATLGTLIFELNQRQHVPWFSSKRAIFLSKDSGRPDVQWRFRIAI